MFVANELLLVLMVTAGGRVVSDADVIVVVVVAIVPQSQITGAVVQLNALLSFDGNCTVQSDSCAGNVGMAPDSAF